MSSYKFIDAERFTVFSADGGKCFWCGVPLFFRDVQVDHVFPEYLQDDPEQMERIRRDYNLGPDFKINDFGNWVTCHQGCNLRKGSKLLPNAPMTIFVVQQLAARAPALQRVRSEFQKDLQKDGERARVLAMLSSAVTAGNVTREDIQHLIAGLPPVPVASNTPEPAAVRLSEDWELLVPTSPAAAAIAQGWQLGKVSGNVAFVHNGKVGGYVPNVERPDPSWICSRCHSHGPWDGIICRVCGNREEPD